jgi:UDP-N-acetylmuramoylalanine--D-glutamate ligase
LGEVGGVLFINDSKATNVASARVAVESMTRPTILLLGGRHKGEPYTALRDVLTSHCRAVIAFGEAKDTIVSDLRGGVNVVPVDGTFADVMRRARDEAKPGDAVLLSPACSSYDMFNNYLERGEAFATSVGLTL